MNECVHGSLLIITEVKHITCSAYCGESPDCLQMCNFDNVAIASLSIFIRPSISFNSSMRLL